MKEKITEFFSKVPADVKVATIYRDGRMRLGVDDSGASSASASERFSQKHWVRLIGKTYTHRKTDSKNPELDGDYVLAIGPAIEGVTRPKYSVVLTQPDGSELRMPIDPKASKTKQKKMYKNLNELKKASGLSGLSDSIARIFNLPMMPDED